MPFVNLTRDVICDALIGGTAYNRYNAANAHIGVGDSTTAHANSQTDLQAATNKLRKIVDSAPTRTTNTMRFISTFGTSEANFTWAEWAVFNASSGTTAPAAMLNRKVEALGTKSGGTWQLTVDVTVTI